MRLEKDRTKFLISESVMKANHMQTHKVSKTLIYSCSKEHQAQLKFSHRTKIMGRRCDERISEQFNDSNNISISIFYIEENSCKEQLLVRE